MRSLSALEAYKDSKHSGDKENISSHKIVSLLMQGIIDKLNNAKGAMLRVEIERRTQEINKTIDIITALRSGLDMEAGGELSAQLDSLYAYMIITLMKANAENSIQKADEVIKLISNLKSGWDEMSV